MNHITYEGEMMKKELLGGEKFVFYLVTIQLESPWEIERPSCCSHGSTLVHSNWSSKSETVKSLLLCSCSSLPNDLVLSVAQRSAQLPPTKVPPGTKTLSLSPYVDIATTLISVPRCAIPVGRREYYCKHYLTKISNKCAVFEF